ncbi:spore germination protein [Paenibacillus sp. FSL M7-1455]|uniref:spore germination protein n=1 Tax=Paenibacillus TaxID=44249 RepID=UPI00203CF2AD|nr:spore germination protein [Paenibacillus lactis]MCM3494629.1 spore germination protein [Paenibacillus lactis]
MLKRWLKKFIFRPSSGSVDSSFQPYTSTSERPSVELADASAILNLFSRCADVKHHTYTLNALEERSSVLFVFCEGMSDSQHMIHEVVLPRLQRFYETYGFTDAGMLQTASQLQLERLPDDDWQRKATQHVFEGKLLMYIPALRVICSVDIAKLPARKPEESNVEVSVRGAKDCFVEELATNAALIRKRLKSPSLAYEQMVLGERTQTRIGLMYMYDIADPKVIQEVKQRLQKITIDGVFSATELEEMIEPTWALFPLMAYTGRPDFTVNCLMNGRFVLLVDGTPAALIGPANLLLLIKTPEDIHFTALSSTFGQMLRLLGLFVSLMLPAFWLCLLSYHQDQLPFYLLATLTVNRLGIPLSTGLEMFLALIFLEMLREAGVHLPSSIGSTLTVVGGLILGDAAIRAGILSPGIVIIGAITHVFGATLTNQALGGAVSILRIILFIFSCIFGLYGFFLGVFLLLVLLASLQSFGVPYLAPMSPPFFKDLPHALFRLPLAWKRKRPEMLHTIDDTNRGEQSK